MFIKPAIIIALIAGIAESIDLQVRGVSPSDQHFYRPDENGSWHCLSDPSIVLSYDQINDDFCDCPDGSDEPGTNACQIREQVSYCANKGHFPAYIENFKLNDGVCDYDVCCDGSDEYLTGKCPNKCAKINKQFQKYKQSVLKDINKSIKLKEQYVQKAAANKIEVGTRLKATRQEIQIKEEELQKKLLEHKELYGTKELDQSTIAFDGLSNAIERFAKQYQAQLDSKTNKVLELEGILAKLIENYNPNFNDLAVKESVNSFQEYISNKKDSSEQEEIVDLQEAIESVRALKSDSITGVEESDSITGAEARTPNLQVVADIDSADLESIKELESTIQSLQVDAHIYEEDLKKNYGTDDILRAVAKSVISTKIGDYSYEFTFLRSIYQDNVLIGSFQSYEDGKLYFSHGHKCWNGPYRSAVVEIVCGSTQKLLSVSEPEKCQYYFEVSSPIVCETVSEEDVLANFKINYDLL